MYFFFRCAESAGSKWPFLRDCQISGFDIVLAIQIAATTSSSRAKALGLGSGRNGIGLKREEAVIVGAGARHLIWHSRRKSPVVVCAPFPKR